MTSLTVQAKQAVNRALGRFGYRIARLPTRPSADDRLRAATANAVAVSERALTVSEQALAGAEQALAKVDKAMAKVDKVADAVTKPAARPTATGPKSGADAYDFDIDEFSATVLSTVLPRTMTGRIKVLALIDAVRYLHRYGIEGAVVECGVWRGGSMMAAAMTLMEVGDTERELFLYDTFEGMPEATEEDVRRRDHRNAADLLAGVDRDNALYARATLDDVRAGMAQVGYPGPVHFVQGKVEDTVPDRVPERIALLRLDTDWYASTAHELEQLYPLLVPGGVLILDDYGYWAGARKAVDDFLERTGEPLLLTRIAEGRIAVKPHR